MKSTRGQSAVEFILVVPLLVFLLVTVVQIAIVCITGERTMFLRFTQSRAAQVFAPGAVLRVGEVPALPAGISADVLTGGDNPSPYCRRGERYAGPWECQ